ncbi:hypothetical protein L484_017407 [Morus notabilis]|uniref:Uncharacterized protein n=1 Tax=Morus notabilis TaxID=981085 RepID=W9R3S6_9ROSA|nr:hypothetical protein L484_017407 [Morus notabilis]
MVPPRELKSEAHKKSSAIDLPKGLDGWCPSTDRIAHIAREARVRRRRLASLWIPSPIDDQAFGFMATKWVVMSVSWWMDCFDPLIIVVVEKGVVRGRAFGSGSNGVAVAFTSTKYGGNYGGVCV